MSSLGTAFSGKEQWEAFATLFPGAFELASQIEDIPPPAVPEPYQSLLVHTRHMTAVLEQHFGIAMNVAVLARHKSSIVYSREILLRRSDDGVAVQFAFGRTFLERLPQPIKDDILGEKIPLGRLIRQHALSVSIRVRTILRLAAGPGLAAHFGATPGQLLFGRFASILSGEGPLFEVIEVLAPTKAAP